MKGDEKNHQSNAEVKYKALASKINEIDEMKISPIELYAILAELKEIVNKE